MENCCCLFFAALDDELAGRLRAEWEKAGEDNRRHTTETDHVSPAMRNVCEAGTDSVGEDLSTSDAHVVKTLDSLATMLRIEQSQMNLQSCDHGIW